MSKKDSAEKIKKKAPSKIGDLITNEFLAELVSKSPSVAVTYIQELRTMNKALIRELRELKSKAGKS